MFRKKRKKNQNLWLYINFCKPLKKTLHGTLQGRKCVGKVNCCKKKIRKCQNLDTNNINSEATRRKKKCFCEPLSTDWKQKIVCPRNYTSTHFKLHNHTFKLHIQILASLLQPKSGPDGAPLNFLLFLRLTCAFCFKSVLKEHLGSWIVTAHAT